MQRSAYAPKIYHPSTHLKAYSEAPMPSQPPVNHLNLSGEESRGLRAVPGGRKTIPQIC